MSLASCILLLCLGRFLVPALAVINGSEDFEFLNWEDDTTHLNNDVEFLRDIMSSNVRNHNFDDEVQIIGSSKSDDKTAVTDVIPKQDQGRFTVPALTVTPDYNEDNPLIMDLRTLLGNEAQFFSENTPRKIVNENSDEVVIVGSSKSDEPRYYNPINKFWQQEKCEQLKVNIEKIFQYDPETKILDSPTRWIKVEEDENSFFRALSLWVCGTESSHHVIRQRVSEVVRTDRRMIAFLGKENHSAYLASQIPQTSYATKVEIKASTILLNTSIYVYTRSKQTWDLFKKHKYPPKKTDKCIYLQRISENGYCVVTDVKPDQEYQGYFFNPEWPLDDEIKNALLSQPDEIRFFNPVDKDWQKAKCDEFEKLELKRNFQYDETPLILTIPKKLVIITKDENCFFRALSYVVTGIENYHQIIRQLVTDVVLCDTGLQNLFKNEYSSSIIQTTLTTDLEIIASTLLLDTSIFVYSHDKRKWDLYNKDIINKSPVNKNDMSIYMSQSSPDKYDVVEGVEDFFDDEEMLDNYYTSDLDSNVIYNYY
ncbi:uncharacterized protein LOC126843127 [Adelges cooleyi]|uniref:uncharacterized protein LOC126843127 n=1 Tax=Adelges cooleyi TaxID=133065 RepID=UPI00217F535B|nr:uncharacterized protein LOC126843127 [Adelges cooleyi]